MLILCRISIVGILFLTHIAHGFVLLTANMEDVKKLAQKFVSESLADKIAELLAKASQNMDKNLSDEKEKKQESLQQVSEENNKHSFEKRDSESAGQDTVKSKEEADLEKEHEELSELASSEQKNEMEYETASTTKSEKSRIPTLKGQNRYTSYQNSGEEYYRINSKKTISKINEEDDKYMKENIANKYLENNLVSTPSYEEQTKKTTKKNVKGRPNRFHSQVTEMVPDSHAVGDDFDENELYNQKSNEIELTTGKVEFELDQNESKQHQSSEISTSEPLPAPDKYEKTENWWEKEITKENPTEDREHENS